MNAPYLNPLYQRLEFDVPPCRHDNRMCGFAEGDVVSTFMYCDDCGIALTAPFDWQQDGFLNGEDSRHS